MQYFLMMQCSIVRTLSPAIGQNPMGNAIIQKIFKGPFTLETYPNR